MVLEHALLSVAPGREAEFEEAFAHARSIIAGTDGFGSLTLSRCVERPGTYLLLVTWRSLEDHTEGFRGSAGYHEWRRLLHHFYDPFPVVEHYTQVLTAAPPLPAPPVPGVVPPRERRVSVVTHPEATHHVDDLVGGHLDSALTARGERQAAAIAATLRDRVGTGSVAVVTSDLRRCRRTAEVVADALGTAPTCDVRLREISYGEAGGRPQAWLDERYVAPPAVGDRLRHDVGVAGAETRLDVAVRVYRAMTELLAQDVDELVVVTHGFTAGLVVAAWLGMPIEAAGHVAFPVTSGSITTLREDGYFHNRGVLDVGDARHLADL